MLLTHAALLGLAMQCVQPPEAVPLLLRIIEGPENRARDTEAVSKKNSNGTYDYGLGMVNSGNFGMLERLFGRPINAQTILDPCMNLAAAGAILIGRYNGSQAMPDIGSAYVRSVINAPNGGITAAVTPESPPSPPCAPAWDAWAVAACSRGIPGTATTTVATLEPNHAR